VKGGRGEGWAAGAADGAATPTGGLLGHAFELGVASPHQSIFKCFGTFALFDNAAVMMQA
jgi:hypothetical protein